MSLNGLDAAAVTQAYQSALAEAGGWFLLKYTARDAVDVLTAGTGGAHEARAAVAQYEDKSPLYGLLLYRRRRVLVKYVPEGTSRLLQARVAVHFITVTDRFAPHDFVLSISSPEELSDAALTSACTLHTAAPSSSSSSGSSARHQKLSWIREESEAPGQPAGDDTAVLHRSPTASSTVPTVLEPTPCTDDDPLRTASVASAAPSQHAEQVPVVLDEHAVAAHAKLAPDVSHTTVEAVTQAPPTPDADNLSDFRETLTSYDKLFDAGPEPRASSQTARPDYNELYEHYYAQYTKPKEKLGPRPRASQEGRRPSTSGSGSQPGPKTKSSLPSGLRSANRKAAEAKKPRLKDSASAASLTNPVALPIPPPSPIPETPISPISVTFSLKSPASVRSMPVSFSGGLRSHGNTQEKARLMKALELRKKQMKAQQDRQSKLAEETAEAAEAAAEDAAENGTAKEQGAEPVTLPADDSTTSDASGSKLTAEDADAATPLPARNGEDAVEAHNKEEFEDRKISLEEDTTSSHAMDSSGMVYTNKQTENDDLNSAVSVSSPLSAQTQGSSVAPSTRPSSLSEDDHNNMDDAQKAADLPEHTTWDALDEQQSIDSSPTVVPESKTPVPSLDMQTPSQLPTPPEDAPLEANEIQTSKRESTTTLMPPSPQDQSRRSNRESTIYMPPDEHIQQNDSQSKRRNRESMILPTSKRESWYQTKEKRRALLDPIQVSADNSEAEYLSDDSFMEELRSAEVRQAKPMSVSKSPIMPVFPRQPSEPKISSPPKRAASTSFNQATRTSPEQLARKSSGPWTTSTRSEDMGPPAKMNSVKVSGGIAQRIKALAEKSKRDSTASLSPHDPPRSRPGSSLAQRKSNFFAASPIDRSPSGTPIQRLGSPSHLSLSNQTTPDKKPTLEPSPISTDQTVYNLQQVEQPETVQVTARIIQDDRTKQPTLAMPTETTPLDLHQSPLIIDHQKPTFVPKSPTRVKTAPAATMDPASPRAPSSSNSRDQGSALPRSSSESSWRSFGRRMSETRSIHSPDGEEEKREEKKGKKDSRTSKLFKRMSSGLGLKSSQSGLALPEQDLRSTSLSSLREPPPPVQVGEINVQFPDTLLWKRRFAEIDATGNLILGPSISNPKGLTKRFHLTEFKAPYPPDQDQQELPNSVVLDFVDGRTLQCACESSALQAHVLQILREAHDAWIAHSQTA
ncbi:gpi-anchored cell surface glycoprotein [Stagonosporopsis vannaccii]|nr:gpi-anchored cell surface glycoprotein [Stagonosporopsis vannaccii]